MIAKIKVDKEVLTRDGVGATEGSGHVGIQLDHHVVEHHLLLVTLLDAVHDPLLEGFADEAVDHVDDPLLG